MFVNTVNSQQAGRRRRHPGGQSQPPEVVPATYEASCPHTQWWSKLSECLKKFRSQRQAVILTTCKLYAADNPVLGAFPLQLSPAFLD